MANSNVMLSQSKVVDLIQIIKKKPGHTAAGYANMINRALAERGQPTNVEAAHVHNFLNHHPRAQEVQGMVAVSNSTRRLPNWANEQTSRVNETERKPGELVAYVEKTGDKSFDDAMEKSMNVVALVANYVPNSKQDSVVALGSALNYAAYAYKTREEVYAASERERKTLEKLSKVQEQRINELQSRLPPAAE